MSNKKEDLSLQILSSGKMFGFKSLLNKSPIEAIAKIIERHGDFIKVKLFGKDFYLINHSQLIEYVLKENPDNYRNSNSSEISKEFLINGIFHKDDGFAQTVKKIINPSLTKEQTEEYFNVVLEETEILIQSWIAEDRRESVINIELEMQRLAVIIAVRIYIAPQLEINVDPILDALSDIMDINDLGTIKQRKKKKFLSKLLPFITADEPRLADAVEYINTLSSQIAEEYLRKNVDKGFLMTQLFDAYQGNKINFDGVVAILKEFFITSFLSIAETMTWLLYAADKTQGLRKKIEAEIDAVLHEKTFDFESLKSMKLLNSVMYETLRMYPSTWAFQKIAIKDDTLNGNIISANTRLLIFPLVLQRNESVWENPLIFDPERFLKVQKNQEIQDFIPFGDESDICFNKNFILLEIQTIAAVFFKQIRVYYQTKKQPGLRATPILLPNERLLALAVKRSNFSSQND